MRQHIRIAGYIFIASVLVFAFIGVAWAGLWFQATQLTDGAFDDDYPQISGNKAVWVGLNGPGGTGEIHSAVLDRRPPKPESHQLQPHAGRMVAGQYRGYKA